MNYSGIFDAKLAAGGSGLHSGVHLETVSPHATEAPADAIVVPDAQLLFNGDFKRAGVDLILSKDGRELVLQDYFKGEKHAALCSPDGARLTGDIVDALTGHTQFAQADGNAGAGRVIGHVTKLAGTATAIRNGVSIILHQGDNVEKGDVVQSGSGSTLGITFIDGTVFGLSSNARMVLNEMVYDPNGSNNSSLLSLVQGTITFVAGETAKHGDMKVNTPVATMGIRGTAVLVEIDFTVPGQGGAPPVKFHVLAEPDGHTGSYLLYSLTDPNVVLGQVNLANQIWTVTASGDLSTSPAPPLSLAAQEIIGQTFQTFFQSGPPNNANPRSNGPPGSTPANPPTPGKPDDTSPLKFDTGTPKTVIIPINLPAPTPTNPGAINPFATPIPVTFTVLKAIDVTPVVDTPSFNIGDQVTISDSFSSDTLVPYVPGTATILSVVGPAPAGTNLKSLVSVDPQTGKVTYNPESFAFLQPGQKVTVTVGFESQAGTNIFQETLTLTIDNVLPTVTIATPGGATSSRTQTISGAVADGHAAVGATVILFDTVNGVTTKIGTATVQPDGTWTTTVTLSGNGVHSIVAEDTDAAGNTGSSAPVVLTLTNPTNIFTWSSDASGSWSDPGNWNNSGVVPGASDHAEINFSDIAVTVPSAFAVDTLSSAATLDIKSHGSLTISGADGDSGNSGKIEIHGVLELDGGVLDNSGSEAHTGSITVHRHGTLTVNDATIAGGTVTNKVHGNIDLTGSAALVHGSLRNFGQINVSGSGNSLDGESVTVNYALEVLAGAALLLDQRTKVDNAGGTITIDGPSAVLTLDDATIKGGTIDDYSHGDEAVLAGLIDVTGSSKIDGAILNNGDVTVASRVTLTLDDVTVNGTKFTDTGTLLVRGDHFLTLDGATISGGKLSIKGTLDLVCDSAIQDGTLVNSYQIDVSGSDALREEMVTNHGLLEVLAGGTLHLDQGTTVANAGGFITVDHRGTLILNDATIKGGELSINGTLDLICDSAIQDGTLANSYQIDVSGSDAMREEMVANDGRLEILAGGTLHLDQGTTVANAGGFITIDHRGTLILNGATIEGGTIDDFSYGDEGNLGGLIKVTGASKIDDHAVLNHGEVKVESQATLTLDDVIVNGTKFIDTGTLLVDGHHTLTLDGATISGGTIDDYSIASEVVIPGVIDIAGSSTIDAGATLNGGAVRIESGQTLTLDDVTATGTSFEVDGAIISPLGQLLLQDGTTLSSSHLQIDSGDQLTLNHATISGGLITGGGAIVVTGSSTIDGGASLNHGNVTVKSGQTLTLDNVTVNGTTFNDSATGSIIKVDSGDILTLNGATIDGGAFSIAGTVNIAGATTTLDTTKPITNNGLLEVSTGSKLVIDDAVTGTGRETIADGAVLEFKSSVASTQTITFTGPGELYLTEPTSFSGKIAGLSGNDLLDLRGFDPATTTVKAVYAADDGVTTLTVTDRSGHSASLTLVGDYQADNFAFSGDGNGGTLIVLNQETPIAVTAQCNRDDTATASQVYQAKGAAISSTDGSGLFISNADSNASDLIVAELNKASSIDVSASGHNGIALDIAPPSLEFSSAASVAVFNAAAITASGSGDIGIFAAANNNVTVDDSGDVSGGRYAIEAIEASAVTVGDVDVSIGPNATIKSTVSSSDTGYGGYGILAANKGAGNISVRTSAGDHIHSEGAGIDAVNEATSADASDHSTIVVNAFGKIHSGSIDTGAGHPPAGIVAGYFGSGDSDPTSDIPGLYGDVTVNNSADITADAGDGIRAYDYGIGDVTVNDLAGSITALGGCSPVDGYGNGIAAFNYGTGNIDIFTAAGTSIHSGSSGIDANNAAQASLSSSEILVVAYGTIESGAIPTGSDNLPAGILAGYDSNQSADNDVHGNVVIDDYASIMAAAGTDGIRGYNYGTGTVTVIAEAGAEITAGRYGLAARGHDGGDVSVTNYGTVTATTAIDANTTGSGNVDIDNHGTITGDIVVGDASPTDAPFTGHATIHNESGALWNLVGASTFAGTSELVNDGTIDSIGHSSITTTGVMNISNDGTVNVQCGALDVGAAVTGAGSFTIADGAHLEFASSVSATETVTFQGSTGDLTLDNPSSFAALISGFTGDGMLSGSDQIDLKGINYSALSETFNAATDTLSVSDGTDSATLQFSGSYLAQNFSFESDGHGGTIVYDPPVPATASSAAGPAASETIVASAANATLTGTGASENFVFNFVGVGQAKVTDFHPATDALQFSSPIFATAQAALNATQDDGHGNTVVTLDAHDTITLAGVLKAQLNVGDFHVV